MAMAMKMAMAMEMLRWDGFRGTMGRDWSDCVYEDILIVCMYSTDSILQYSYVCPSQSDFSCTARTTTDFLYENTNNLPSKYHHR
jgi:hypothetical protein